MAVQIELDPGPPNAIWESDGIRLRSQRETNLTNIGPHINPGSGQSYFTYVKITNRGTDPIGACPCGATGAWAQRTMFIDTFTPTWPVTAPDGNSKLVYLTSTDQFQLQDTALRNIAGPWFFHGQTATGSRTGGLKSFWGWSPDGLFFAVIVRDMQAGGGGTWWLYVYATRAYTRADGVRNVPIGAIFSSNGQSTALNVIAGLNLGWNAASTCLVLTPPPMPGQSLTQTQLTLVCPYADSASNSAPTYSRTLDPTVVQLSGWDYLHSPCGGLFALVPQPQPNVPSAAAGLELVDIRRTLAAVQQRQDNLPVNVQVTHSGATLTTTGPGRRGIALGNMNPTPIDNPECATGTPSTVDVRRVRVTTNPNQIDYQNTGLSSAVILPGQSLWVEFPSMVWINPGNPGQVHYCLQAMGGAPPGDPAPGWANVNLGDRHYAQRNIAFA